MSLQHTYYLEQERLRGSPSLLISAVAAVVDAGLALAASYQLEYDRPLLEAILDAEAMATLLPGPRGLSRLERQRHPLSGERVQLLRSVATFGAGPWDQPAMSAVEHLILFDKSGSVVLRISDGGDAVLFALPPTAHGRLIIRLAAEGVPAESVQLVPVDIDKNV